MEMTILILMMIMHIISCIFCKCQSPQDFLGIVIVVFTTLMLFFVSVQLVVHFHKLLLLLLQFKVNGQVALSCSGERAGANERDLSCAASNRFETTG